MNPPDHPPLFDPSEVERRAAPLAERLSAVRARIATAGGDGVKLLAVTKGHPVEAAIAAVELGLDELGENYAQDLAAKARILEQYGARPQWHFIGQLQSNKVRMIAGDVALWQSVDRLKVGREIAKRAPGARVLAQVNLSSEPQKAGCSFEEVDALVAGLRDLDLEVEGLMGVGSAADEIASATGFRRLRAAVDRHHLTVCSMGMTADLELAIREGSTMVRVGSDLFGPRP